MSVSTFFRLARRWSIAATTCAPPRPSGRMPWRSRKLVAHHQHARLLHRARRPSGSHPRADSGAGPGRTGRHHQLQDPADHRQRRALLQVRRSQLPGGSPRSRADRLRLRRRCHAHQRHGPQEESGSRRRVRAPHQRRQRPRDRSPQARQRLLSKARRSTPSIRPKISPSPPTPSSSPS